MVKTCIEEGCLERARSRGMCLPHYRAWYKAQTEPVRRPTIGERFWTRVDKTNSCWLWTTRCSANGYGQFSSRGRTVFAHRMAYELTKGPIPAGLQIDHLCRNRRCVNPDHLEAVTPRTNVMRSQGVAAHNAVKTHCKHGHAFTPENTYLVPGGRKCRACTRLRKQRRAKVLA